jgi:nucleoside-diphosphate-sugar epimerase
VLDITKAREVLGYEPTIDWKSMRDLPTAGA